MEKTYTKKRFGIWNKNQIFPSSSHVAIWDCLWKIGVATRRSSFFLATFTPSFFISRSRRLQSRPWFQFLFAPLLLAIKSPFCFGSPSDVFAAWPPTRMAESGLTKRTVLRIVLQGTNRRGIYSYSTSQELYRPLPNCRWFNKSILLFWIKPGSDPNWNYTSMLLKCSEKRLNMARGKQSYERDVP